MKNVIRMAVLSAVVSGLTACRQQVAEGTETVVDYTMDQFEEVSIDLSGAETIKCGDLLLGAPVAMTLVDDNVLAVYDPKNEDLITLMNPEIGAWSRCLHRGSGPNESLGVSNIYEQDGKLYVSPSQDGRMYEITVDRSTLGTELECVAKLPEDMLRSVKVADDMLIYSPFFADSIRFVKTTTAGEAVDTIGNLELVVGTGEFVPRNSLAQMNIALSPDKSVMVAANMSWNVIELYDLEHDNLKVLRGPVEINSKIEKMELPFGTTYKQKPRWECFRNLSVTDKGFDVGYIGVEVTSSEDLERKISTILFFDIEGKPVKRLSLSEEVLCYALDYGSMTLYFVAKDGDPEVKKMKLPLAYKDMY